MSSITGVDTQKKIQKVTFWRDGYKIQTQSNNQAKKGKKGTKPERTKTELPGKRIMNLQNLINVDESQDSQQKGWLAERVHNPQ